MRWFIYPQYARELDQIVASDVDRCSEFPECQY